MIKRLALLCCILLLPTIAAAQGTTNYGDFWVGGQLGGVFTLDRNITIRDLDTGFQFTTRNNIKTDAAFSAGAIVGYNFCMPYRQPWERYFGVALDFQWNQFNQSFEHSRTLYGNEYALSFLGRFQYPLMGSDTFTRGRVVPFLMAGPAIVWSESDFKHFGGNKTSTDVGIVAEIGLEFFIVPQLSVGPSFRYRHVFGPNFESHGVRVDSQLDQFMILGRLAYHF